MTNWQTWAVAIVVPVCALHAAWRLAGAGARHRALAWLARTAWPKSWRRSWHQTLQRAEGESGGCGCAGCDRAHPASPPSAVVLVHRPPRSGRNGPACSGPLAPRRDFS
jgi:hypothetical protein